MKKHLVLSSVAIIASMLLTGCTSDEFATTSDMTKSTNPNRVPIAEALQKADAMLAGIQGVETRGASKLVKSVDYKVTPATRSTEAVDTAFYLVNYQDGGFAILGADRRLDDVYAISDQGSLSWKDGEDNEALGFYFSCLDNLAHEASTDGYGVPINPPVIVPDKYFTRKCTPRLKGNLRNFADLSYFRSYYDLNGNQVSTSSIDDEAALACMLLGYQKNPKTRDGYEMEWDKVESTGKSNGLCYLMKKLSGPYDNSHGGDKYNVDYHLVALKNRYALDPSTGSVTYVDTDPTPEGYEYVDFNDGNVISFLGRTELWHDPTIINPHPEYDEIAGKPCAAKGYNSKKGRLVQWIIDGYIEYESTDDTTQVKYLDRYFHCVWGRSKVNDGYFRWTRVNKFTGDPDEYDSTDSKSSDGSVNIDQSIKVAIKKVEIAPEFNN